MVDHGEGRHQKSPNQNLVGVLLVHIVARARNEEQFAAAPADSRPALFGVFAVLDAALGEALGAPGAEAGTAIVYSPTRKRTEERNCPTQ